MGIGEVDETHMSKKEKRKEAKKRKLSALIELVEDNDSKKLEKRIKSDESNKAADEKSAATGSNGDTTGKRFTEEEYQIFKAKRREIQKAKMEWPVFFICDIGHDAKIDVSGLKSDLSQTKATLGIQDIQDLMLAATIGRKSPRRTRWCKLMRNNKLSHTLVVIADGLSLKSLQQNFDYIPSISSLFQSGVVLNPEGSRGNVTGSLFSVHLSNSLRNKLIKKLEKNMKKSDAANIHEACKILFPNINDAGVCNNKFRKYNKCNVTELLLDPLTMIHHDYPFNDIEAGIMRAEYVYTKENYAKVTSSSPLFAVDCEMCMTSGNTSELTRISIVDEDLKVVYDRLVKPKNHITDYLTHFSGITEEMLKNVTLTLEDVQRDVKNILPSDAILCGHSLNCDLNAMKMMHPYVIDTSIAYNLSGIIYKKPALRNLSQMFLDEIIQQDINGHNPQEDSSATMKLVLLKLKQGVEFGNVLYNYPIPEIPKESDKEHEAITEERKSSSFVRNYSNTYSSFTTHTKKEHKKICVVGKANLLQDLNDFIKDEHVKAVTVEDNTDCVKRTREVLLENNLTMCHLDIDSSHENSLSEHTLKKLDKRIEKLHKSCAAKSLFILLVPGSESNDHSIQNGFCMAKIKQ